MDTFAFRNPELVRCDQREYQAYEYVYLVDGRVT